MYIPSIYLFIFLCARTHWVQVHGAKRPARRRETADGGGDRREEEIVRRRRPEGFRHPSPRGGDQPHHGRHGTEQGTVLLLYVPGCMFVYFDSPVPRPLMFFVFVLFVLSIYGGP